MNLDDIRKVLDLVREHDLAEFELEQEGLKLRVRKAGHEIPSMAPAAPVAGAVPCPPPCRLAAAGRRPVPRRGAADGDGPGHRQVADRRHLLPRARARRAAFVEVGDPVREGPGALHHRGDEADERDRVGVRRRDRRASTSRTASRCSTASGCSRIKIAERPHVQEDPDRQPRRDRAARHLRVPRAGHQDRRRLLRGRRELAARPLRRRGRLHRPGRAAPTAT